MNEIFTAIYNRLTAQLTMSVYDYVPQDSSDYPFVKMQPLEVTNDDDDTKNGFAATISIIGYSRYRGIKEINNLVDEVYAALHHFDIYATTSYQVGDIMETSRTIINAPDGLTKNSIQNFRLFFQPK